MTKLHPNTVVRVKAWSRRSGIPDEAVMQALADFADSSQDVWLQYLRLFARAWSRGLARGNQTGPADTGSGKM